MKPNPFHVLPPNNRERDIAGVVRVLEAIFPNKPVVVSWKIAQPDKTPQQNRYLWAVPYKMLKEATGYSETDLHEWNCGEQWGWKEKQGLPSSVNPSGITNEPVRTTTRNADGDIEPCTGKEMEELWERCQKLGANLGCVIPDPDPDYWKKK